MSAVKCDKCGTLADGVRRVCGCGCYQVLCGPCWHRYKREEQAAKRPVFDGSGLMDWMKGV